MILRDILIAIVAFTVCGVLLFSVSQDTPRQQRCQAGSADAPAKKEATDDRLHIAIVSHGWNLQASRSYHQREDGVTIKGPIVSLRVTVIGILKHTTRPVSLYFIVGENDKAEVRNLMEPIKYWRASLEWSFILLDEPQLDSWLRQIGHKPTHRTGRSGNIKFFYPLVYPLSKIDKLIALDTDVLINHDLKDLWSHFDKFEDQQLYAMAPQLLGPAHPTKENVFNAGIMLMRMDRMRDVDWLKLARDSINYWHWQRGHPKCCFWADQSVFHMIRAFRHGALGYSSGRGYIPRHWNINKCQNYSNVGQGLDDPLPQHIPYIGLVHLGCCTRCTREQAGPRFAALFDELNSTRVDIEFAVPTSEFSTMVKFVEYRED